MKKLSSALLVTVLTAFLFMQTSVFAADSPTTADFCNGAGKGTEVCKGFIDGTKNDPIVGGDSILVTIVDILVWVIAVAAVIGVVIGGYRYVFSGGDSQRTASARQTIIYSLVGLAVAVMSRAIVAFVIGRS